MKGGAGDEEQQYESGKRINDAVQRVGLPLRLDERTRGDGNCWTRAVIQQCQRPSVGINSLANHVELRSRVCQLALEERLDVIKEMRKNWIRRESWRAYWERMERNKVWADHPFIQVTAWLLERDIYVVMDSATPRSMFMTFSGSREGQEKPCPQAPLLIGNDNNQHFQSLLPEDEVSFHPSQFSCWTPEQINQAVEEIVQKQRRWEYQRKKRGLEVVTAETCREDDKGCEKIVFDNVEGGPRVEITHEGGNHRYKCLHCFTQPKQIPSHMRKVHFNRFSHEILEEFGKEWKVFANNLADARRVAKRKAEDLEGFNKKISERVAKCKAKKMMEDKEGFMETQRKQEATRKSRRMDEDRAGFMETQRKQQASRKSRRMDEDREGFNEKHREEVAKYRGNAENTYLNEVRLAAIFPCVCCHTLNFRQQVVEFSQKQATTIKEKALAVYQKQKV